MNSRTLSIDTIFAHAIDIVSPEERQAYLDRACGSDPDLRARLDRLVVNYFKSENFLEKPPIAEIRPTADYQPRQSESLIGMHIGPYKLRELIGEGGMGAVYVADQEKPIQRRVAIKLIKPGMDSKQVVARFEAERQALALMDHPNIAKILDGGTTESGHPYFVMELVRGIPITEYCDQAKLTTTERLRLFTSVCDAVQHAHQRAIIHRDLKPSNILITLYDGVPVPKVIDFGIAKAIGLRLTDQTIYTAMAQIIGSPLYMSPEQAEMSALDVDTRADVYALGVVLYELLTGGTPFDRDTLLKSGFDEMRRVLREVEPQRPSQRISTLDAAARSTISARRGIDPRRHRDQLRGELDWVVMKCLEKDRNRRYESPSALAADVQRYLADRPVEACPPSAGYRLRKLARRNRTLLLAGGLIGFTLVVATGVSTWQAIKADRARAIADAEKVRADENYRRARSAVKQMLTQVAIHEASRVPEMQATREKLLNLSITFYTDLLQSNPTDAEVYFERGQVYRHLVKYDEAMRDFEACIEHDPHHLSCHVALGLILSDVKGDPKRALTYFRRAVEIQEITQKVDGWETEPHQLHYWVMRTNAFVGTKSEFERWRKSFNELAPPSANTSWANARISLLMGDRQQALAYAERAVQQDPNHPWGHRMVAECRQKLGDDRGALLAINESVRLTQLIHEPWAAEFLGIRANLSWKLGDYRQSIEDFHRVFELDPPYRPLSYVQRGMARWHSGDVLGAQADIVQAIALDPQLTSKQLDSPMRLHKVDAYHLLFQAMGRWQLGEEDRAEQLYDQAIASMHQDAMMDKSLYQLRSAVETQLGIVPPELVPPPRIIP